MIDTCGCESDTAGRSAVPQKFDQAVIAFASVPELKSLPLGVRILNQRSIPLLCDVYRHQYACDVRSVWLAIVGALLSVPINLRMLALTVADQSSSTARGRGLTRTHTPQATLAFCRPFGAVRLTYGLAD